MCNYIANLIRKVKLRFLYLPAKYVLELAFGDFS